MGLEEDLMHEKPRMMKKKDGMSHKKISVAAILGEEPQHLPIFVDKIRTTEQLKQDIKVMSDKYLTRTYAVGQKQSVSTKSLGVVSSDNKPSQQRKRSVAAKRSSKSSYHIADNS